MKPRILTLQAFGPFAGREIIDFTRLPSDALFLIHGPTGAGKSTILDGICFALYGTTSGGMRQPKEMRSHHAPDKVQTEVELEFELGAKRYLVKRIPEQERAANKGESRLVKVLTKAELHEWNSNGWNLLAAKATDVSNRISTMLGFEADQFRQVIMLPQGQFRRLLEADSKDREKILEALFDTGKFKKLQERLLASARELEHGAADAGNKRTTLLQQAEVDSEDALIQLIAEATSNLAALEVQAEQHRHATDNAQQALSSGEALATKFKDRDAAQTSFAQINAEEAIVVAERTRHGNAMRAQNVTPAWVSVSDARIQHHDNLTKVTQAALDADKAAKDVLTSAAVLEIEEKKTAEREAVAREISRLEEIRSAVIRLNEADQERKAATKAREVALIETGKWERELKDLSERRDSLNQQVETLSPLAARSEAIRLEADQLKQQLKTLQQIVSCESDIIKLRGEAKQQQSLLDATQTDLATARKRSLALNADWRAGQAAVLADHLVDGSPCPVCGSQEHPIPAVGGKDIPTEEQLQSAADQIAHGEAAVESARQSQQAVAQKLGEAEVTLRVQRESLGITMDGALPSITDVEANLIRLNRELGQAQQALVTLETLRKELASCGDQLKTIQQSLETAHVVSDDTAAKLAASESIWTERAGQVPETLRDPAVLQEVLTQAKTSHESLTRKLKQAQDAQQAAQSNKAASDAKLKTLQEASANSHQREQKAQADFLEAMAQQRFMDEADFTAARLMPEAIHELDKRIRQHDEALAAARERLKRAEAAVIGVQPPNLEELTSCLKTAKDQREAVLAQHARLKTKMEQQKRTAEMLDQIRMELDDFNTRYKRIGHLAEIANGKNGCNLTFQRYVLAALLDDVLRQASQRLRKMTSNRYTLQRSLEVAHKGRAAGLDIEVFDEQTGTARSANTLSGGEGFMASLSLALGLSDVVQGYAGGIQLDTLFIDEGFGTLDPESLDMAMKALIELQQKGRLVGIISHVDDLKQQMEHGIEVRFAAGGSCVRVGAIAGH